MKLLIRWLLSTISLFVAVWVIPGIRVVDSHALIAVGLMAFVLGLVNAVVRPILVSHPAVASSSQWVFLCRP